MIKRIVWMIGVVLLVLAAYLGLWPVPIHAVAWKAPAAPGYTGPHAANDKLAGLTLIPLGAEAGPEHIVLARDGKLYAAMASGNIVRMPTSFETLMSRWRPRRLPFRMLSRVDHVQRTDANGDCSPTSRPGTKSSFGPDVHTPAM